MSHGTTASLEQGGEVRSGDRGHLREERGPPRTRARRMTTAPQRRNHTQRCCSGGLQLSKWKARLIASGFALVVCGSFITGASPASAQGDASEIPVSAATEAASMAEFEETGRISGTEPISTWAGAGGTEISQSVQTLADALRERFEGTEGYGLVEWIAEEEKAVVWWHGEVPAEVNAFVSAAAEVVPVEVASMNYSIPELNAAAQEILEASAEAEFGINLVSTNTDGSGLTVSFEEQQDADLVIGARRGALTSDVLGATEVFPVTVEIGGVVSQTADDRLTPAVPYAGGTRMYATYTGSGCTSAFAVKITAPMPDRNKPTGMMTAQHCGNWGPGVWATSNGVFYGYKASEYSSTGRDSSVLVNDQTKSGVADTYPLYYPMMYGGGVSGASRFVVVAGATPVVGADWCYSGSYSGGVCGNIVNSVNNFVNYSSAATNVGPLVQTTQANGIPAAGNGDSGGPAISYSNAGTTAVTATGIISGIRGGSPACTGVPGGAGDNDRKCSTVVLTSPIYSAMDGVGGGVVLMTNTNYNN